MLAHLKIHLSKILTWRWRLQSLLLLVLLSLYCPFWLPAIPFLRNFHTKKVVSFSNVYNFVLCDNRIAAYPQQTNSLWEHMTSDFSIHIVIRIMALTFTNSCVQKMSLLVVIHYYRSETSRDVHIYLPYCYDKTKMRYQWEIPFYTLIRRLCEHMTI